MPHHPPRRSLLAWVALVGCAGACSPLTSMQTARVLPPGASRIALGVGTGYNLVAQQPSALPVAELGYRYGIADRLDVGVRVRPINVLVDGKLQFWDAGRVYASFGPGLSYGGMSPNNSSTSIGYSELGVHVPLYFGGIIAGRSEWLLGPKIVGRYSTIDVKTNTGGTSPSSMSLVGSQSRFVLLAGGLAGATLGLGRRWSLSIEADLYRDLTENTGTATEIAGGLACEFGR